MCVLGKKIAFVFDSFSFIPVCGIKLYFIKILIMILVPRTASLLEPKGIAPLSTYSSNYNETRSILLMLQMFCFFKAAISVGVDAKTCILRISILCF